MARLFRTVIDLIAVLIAMVSFATLADETKDFDLDFIFQVAQEKGSAVSPGSSETRFYLFANFGGGNVDVWTVFPGLICKDSVPQNQTGKFNFKCNDSSELTGNYSFVGEGIIRMKLASGGQKAVTYIANLNKQMAKDQVARFYGAASMAVAAGDQAIDKVNAQLEKERAARQKAEQAAAALAAQKEQEARAREAERAAAELAAKKAAELAALNARLEQEKLARQKAEQAARQKAEQPAISQPAVSQPAISPANTDGQAADSNSALAAPAAMPAKWQQAKDPEQAQLFVNEIQASIVMYMAISDVIQKQPPRLKDRVLGTVENEITRLRAEKERLQTLLTRRFSTPIRPTNANLQVSAFRASDTFPKIPFYVPGTNEIGEMLAVPRITDEGYLEYQFDFLDPTASFEKVRERIAIRHEDIDILIDGLFKVDEWTIVAQENGLNRRFEKTAGCIPSGACENKKQGVSSTEIIFQVYEDGSTAGRVQRNKGLFSVGYNMSVESSILLSAYLTYMRDVGAKEFSIGIMSDKEVDALFE